jgi:4-carboxymuconolactone decarboxylase
MKEANKKAISEFLQHTDSISDDILEDTQEMLGSMPFILPVQKNERPDCFALSCLADDMICRPRTFPQRPPSSSPLLPQQRQGPTSA